MSASERSAFFSHSSADSAFVLEVAGYLGRCFKRVFCYEEHQKKGDFISLIQEKLENCNVFVFFIGAKTSTSQWQKVEIATAVVMNITCIPVQLPDSSGKKIPIPKYATFQASNLAIWPNTTNSADALDTAIRICGFCGIEWSGKDGLPAEPNLFHYEKEIIKFYEDLERSRNEIDKAGMRPVREKLLSGCPLDWPGITRRRRKRPIRNPLIPFVGNERQDNAYVLVSALRPKSESSIATLSFPEAGPRSQLYFPRKTAKKFKVAVLVVGGIAPGINAVIDGIVQRHWLYAKKGKYSARLEVHGLINGVDAFDDLGNSHRLLVSDANHLEGNGLRLETPPHAHEGGSILGTCRDDTLMKEPERDKKLRDIVHQLQNFEILYVIGGDGGMRMAHAIRSYAAHERTGDDELSVVAIPKTMDNDILWVWQSFGFMSAVEKAREVIEHIHTEITSNPRLGIVQLFGSVSGFVVSHAVLAGSTPKCYLALVPEVPFSLKRVATYLKTRLGEHGTIPGGLIIMAETALPTDAHQILKELDSAYTDSSGKAESVLNEKEAEAVDNFLTLQRNHKTLSGQTSDELRSACLKIVSRGLEHLLKRGAKSDTHWSKLRVVTNEPRHIIRAIPPSCQDIITGRRLGSLAVDNAMAGYTDFMISQWLTEFVLVPLPLVVLGRKQIHREGIFWKSVLAKTGSWDCFEPQPSDGAGR